MTGERVAKLIALCAIVAVIVWVARNTYWTDVTVPLPLRGEAARNPFYATQRFAQALGAQTEWQHGLTPPPADGVLVLGAWSWELSSSRRRQIEQWVESGGRLLVDASLVSATDAFEHWSGVGHAKESDVPGVRRPGTKQPGTQRSGAPRTIEMATRLSRCYTLDEQIGQANTSGTWSLCRMNPLGSLSTRGKIDWALRRGDVGTQVVRVPMKKGSVTVVNGTPFSERGVFEDDDGRLFVSAAQLRPGDRIYFTSEDEHTSLLGLTWEFGAPVVCLTGVLLALGLWRGGARFGPLVAPTETARRSLAEQIRGTGEFTMRVGGGEALHAAVARALNEVAARHLHAYTQLPGAERMRALAAATGYEADALAAAVHNSGARRLEHLRNVIALLESARRRILIRNTRSRHGNRI